jgi:hypothetical protein
MNHCIWLDTLTPVNLPPQEPASPPAQDGARQCAIILKLSSGAYG